MKNKLIENLQNIISEETRAGDGYVVYYTEEAAISCAEECKKIAIEFAKWCPTEHTVWVKDHYLTKEEHFDTFIKEIYGKTN